MAEKNRFNATSSLPSLPLASLAFGLGGALAGATLMALLDPASGARRRGTLAAKLRHLQSVARRRGGRQLRHLGNQVQGQLAQVNAQARGLCSSHDADANTLEARVRTTLGRLVEDPTTIEVRAKGAGVVELHGEVARMEQRRVVQGVRRVDGVGEVRSFLQVYDREVRQDDAQAVMH